MGLSNAERQARYKRRLIERAEQAERQVAELQAQLAAAAAEPVRPTTKRHPQRDIELLRNALAAASARVDDAARRLDPRDRDGRKLLEKARGAVVRAEHAVQLLLDHVNKERLVKLKALAERGGTEGEKQAAAAAMERLQPQRTVKPAPLPRSLEEMLARKGKRP